MRELVDEVVACVDECVSAVAAMASRSRRRRGDAHCRGDGVRGDRKKRRRYKPSKSAGAQSFLGAFLETTAATLSTAPPNNTRPSAI